MFSTDNNIETLAQLIEALKEYLSLQKEYIQINTIEKVIRLITVLLLFVVLSFIFMFIIILLSFAAVYWLAESYLSLPQAFCAVALCYLFFFAIIYNKRVAWIQRPLVKVFADILTK